MESADISNNLKAKDVSKIREGCFQVINSNNRAVLRDVAEQILPIRAEITKIELGGAIIPNKHWLQLALKKLELSKSEKCFCALYSYSEFYDPNKEQSAKNISIEQLTQNSKTWSEDYICRCDQCGQQFKVRGEGGWHVPCWKWSRASPT